MDTNQKKRITIYDIAKTLGLSPSTVNRAINGEACVNIKTRELVMETARSIGYQTNRVARGLTRNHMTIAFLINDTISEYRDMVAKGAQKAFLDLADFNIQGQIHIVKNDNNMKKDEENKNYIIHKLEELIEQKVDAIIFSPSSESGYEEVLQKAQQNHIQVGTVLTDVAFGQRLFSVRPNGRMVGRIAADMLHLTGIQQGDPVAILTCNRLTKIFEENTNGFLEQNKKYQFNVVGIYENYDNPDLAYQNTEIILREHPDLKGIYVNSINSVMVAKKLVELNLHRKIQLITVDLLTDIAQYIKSGVIRASVFQDPIKLGELAVQTMYQYIAEKRNVESNIFVSPKIIVDSNMEEYI